MQSCLVKTKRLVNAALNCKDASTRLTNHCRALLRTNKQVRNDRTLVVCLHCETQQPGVRLSAYHAEDSDVTMSVSRNVSDDDDDDVGLSSLSSSSTHIKCSFLSASRAFVVVLHGMRNLRQSTLM